MLAHWVGRVYHCLAGMARRSGFRRTNIYPFAFGPSSRNGRSCESTCFLDAAIIAWIGGKGKKGVWNLSRGEGPLGRFLDLAASCRQRSTGGSQPPVLVCHWTYYMAVAIRIARTSSTQVSSPLNNRATTMRRQIQRPDLRQIRFAQKSQVRVDSSTSLSLRFIFRLLGRKKGALGRETTMTHPLARNAPR